MIVCVCPSCGTPDGIYLSEAEVEADSEGFEGDGFCPVCGYEGYSSIYEMDVSEAIDAGFISEERSIVSAEGFGDQELSWTDGLRSLAGRLFGRNAL